MIEIAGALNWLEDNISGILQWLQKYKAGYLVDLTALHEHLVDMDEVVLRAVVEESRIEGGLRMEISGSDRTLAAIRRIVPARAQELNRSLGWHAGAETVADGVVLTVTSTDPKQVVRIRGLGFIGLLASGTRDGVHHLAMAKAR